MSFICPDCKKVIKGMNCAHALSRLEGWKNKLGCVDDCECGYPVRAKELRAHVFTALIDGDMEAEENAYIYAETGDGRKQGHVYYGTFKNCVRGNGLPASNMSSCGIFERYAAAT